MSHLILIKIRDSKNLMTNGKVSTKSTVSITLNGLEVRRISTDVYSLSKEDMIEEVFEWVNTLVRALELGGSKVLCKQEGF